MGPRERDRYIAVWLPDDDEGRWPKPAAYTFIALSSATLWAAIIGGVQFAV